MASSKNPTISSSGDKKPSESRRLRGSRIGNLAYRTRLESWPSGGALDPESVSELGSACGTEGCIAESIRDIMRRLPLVVLMPAGGEMRRTGSPVGTADEHLRDAAGRELKAVPLERLLRRRPSRQNRVATTGTTESRLEEGALSIDLQRATLTWKEMPVKLSITQFRIVVELASNPSEARSAAELMDAARICVAPNTIAAHIRAIRRRFRAADPSFDAILTERGLGYRWRVARWE